MMPWRRVYRKMLTNPKIKRLPAEKRYFFVTLILSSDDFGRVEIHENVPYSVKELAELSGVSTRKGNETVAYLESCAVIRRDGETIVLLNWDRLQFPSDNSTKRSRDHRKRKRNEAESQRECDVLPERSGDVACNGDASVSDTQITDTEKIRPPIPPAPGGAPALVFDPENPPDPLGFDDAPSRPTDPPKPVAWELVFEEFWSIWPKKQDKEGARTLVKNLSAKDRRQLVPRTQDYLARRSRSEAAGHFVPNLPMAARFMRKKRWNDEFSEEPSRRAASHPDALVGAESWASSWESPFHPDDQPRDSLFRMHELRELYMAAMDKLYGPEGPWKTSFETWLAEREAFLAAHEPVARAEVTS